MPVPAVSPKNWQRATIICHFVTATPVDVVSELAFQDRVLTILNQDKNFTEMAKRNEKNGDKDYTHTDFRGTPGSPHVKQLEVVREKPHRPHVDDSVIDKLQTKVMVEKPSVPAEKLDFDDNLRILLDAAERYYKTVQCEIREERVEVAE